jgi:hypothetical protein
MVDVGLPGLGWRQVSSVTLVAGLLTGDCLCRQAVSAPLRQFPTYHVPDRLIRPGMRSLNALRGTVVSPVSLEAKVRD